MKKIEVLVATMNQNMLSLHRKMNICCDAVIANQCGRWGYAEEKYEYGTIKMISTDTKGVGLNRSIALSVADAEILLFADDDVTYYDGKLIEVIEAFNELSDADVIFFGMNHIKKGEIVEKKINKTQRRFLWNSLRYGTCSIAVRRKSILKAGINFSTLFGGGCLYGSGEDTAFICDCFRAGLKVYSHKYILGETVKDTSSWFTGYNKKYFFDKGALIAYIFPRIKHLIKYYFFFKFMKMTELSKKEIMKNINKGIKAFKELRSYSDDGKKVFR